MSNSLYELATLAGSSLFTALLLALGHYIRKQREPSRLIRYAIGTGTLWIGFALWRALNADWLAAGGLLVIDATGGLAVTLCYEWDDLVRRAQQAEMAEAVDDELSHA